VTLTKAKITHKKAIPNCYYLDYICYQFKQKILLELKLAD